MYVIGKIIGGVLGFIMAGTGGAILGAIIGNLFDKGLNGQFNNKVNIFLHEKRNQVQLNFIKTLACLMGLLAKADGRVSEHEIKFAQHVFKHLKLNEEQRKLAVTWFTLSKNGQVSFQDQQRLLQNLKESNIALCRHCLDLSYQMAIIDGLNMKKVNALNQLLSSIGFSPINLNYDDEPNSYQYQQSSQNSSRSNSNINIHQAFATLELDSTADQKTVKRNYRRLIGQYHPDRMIAKGVGAEELKRATEKTQQISKAYKYICEAKGW
jgi:DnaJ like chaperone protein